MLESTEKGSVRNSIRNCLTVFQNDPLLSGAIAKNLLTERVDIVKPIGYHRIGTAITDTDMNYLLLYLEETYGLTSEKKITAAIGIAQVGILRQEHYAGNWDVFRPATEIEEMNIFTAESLNELLREAEKIMEGWTDYR
jgi:hypothetical protein